ncbi:hypothetical protein AMEX_G17872, partial [Astyanax mexicanus]
GVAGADDVIQPSIIWAEKDKSATINCNHTKGQTYNEMYWFRQYPGKSMELIVFTTTTSEPDFGAFKGTKFSAYKKEAKSGSFTVNEVNSTDNAVYFCAVISSSSDQVFQTPPDQFRKDGESAELHCSHSISGYNRILWYKQTRNQQLQLIGYLAYTQAFWEPEFINKTALSGSGDKNAKLTIKSLTSNDSAVYFCAAFTQCYTHSLSSTKTRFLF